MCYALEVDEFHFWLSGSSNSMGPKFMMSTFVSKATGRVDVLVSLWKPCSTKASKQSEECRPYGMRTYQKKGRRRAVLDMRHLLPLRKTAIKSLGNSLYSRLN